MSSADHFKPMPRKNTGGLFGFIKYHLANIFFGKTVHNYDKDERILNFEVREFDAFGDKLTSNEVAEEKIKQKRLIKASDKLLNSAWSVEIVAALIGIAVAIAVGYSIHRDAGNAVDSNVWINVILGSLPFVMVAIVELSKIPLARVVYNAESLLKTVTFSIVLAAAIFVTWETMVTGMERSIAGQMAKVSKLMIDRENTKLDLKAKKGLSEYSIAAKQSRIEALNREIAAEKTNNQDKDDLELKNNDFSLFETPVETKDKEIGTIETKISARNEALIKDRDDLIRIKGTELGANATDVISNYNADKEQLKGQIAQLTKDIDTEELKFKELRNGVLVSTSADGQKNFNPQPCSWWGSGVDCPSEKEEANLQTMKTEKTTATNKLNALKPPKTDNAAFNIFQTETMAKYTKIIASDEVLKSLDDELKLAKLESGNLRGELKKARNDKSVRNGKLKALIGSSKGKQQAKQDEIDKINGEINTLKQGDDKEQIEIVKKRIRELTAQINDEASNINMYRMAYAWYKKDEFIQKSKDEMTQLTAEAKTNPAKHEELVEYKKALTEAKKAGTLNSFVEKGEDELSQLKAAAESNPEKQQELDAYNQALAEQNASKSGALLYSQVPPKFVMSFAHVWFAILAIVISVVGTIMAFGSFLLRDYHTRTRSGLVEDLKCIWRFITGEEDCRRQPGSANIPRDRAAHPNSRGVNLDENIQYVREAVFIPYLTTDPSIVNAPLQAVADKVEEQDVPNSEADTIADEDSAASSSDDNTDK